MSVDFGRKMALRNLAENLSVNPLYPSDWTVASGDPNRIYG